MSYKKGEESKRRILEAALNISRESGISSLNVRNICQRAQVTTGSFYHHFNGKQELMSEMFAMGSVNYIPFIATILEGMDTEDKFIAFAYYYAIINIKTGYDDLIIRYSPSNPWLKDGVHRVYDLLVKLVKDAMESGEMIPADPEETAYYLVTILRGVILDWCVYKCSYDLCQRMTTYFKLALPPLFKNWKGGSGATVPML